VDARDATASVMSFLRKAGHGGSPPVLVICNFTPVPREGYRVGVPTDGTWRELLNTDAEIYGGTGWGNLGGLEAEPEPAHGRPFSLPLTLPPLSCLYLSGS
jgi:1,4-alpha-glucan branching enzyme